MIKIFTNFLPFRLGFGDADFRGMQNSLEIFPELSKSPSLKFGPVLYQASDSGYIQNNGYIWGETG